jgi:uncharacterized protein YvpB
MIGLAGILLSMPHQESFQMKEAAANEWGFVSVRGDAFDRQEVGDREVLTLRLKGKAITEVVPSWTGRALNGSRFVVTIQPEIVGARAYQLGVWSEGDHALGGRTSINEQDDAFGRVSTDTLTLKQPTDAVTVRVEMIPSMDGTKPRLDRFSAVFSPVSTPKEARQALWGKTLDVPIRAQMNYENGNVLCSPTSVSMILSYWARRMETPAIDEDVPGVRAGVYDPGWSGTGNWIFNTAFAGTRLGMTGYVSRLSGVSDLEALIGAGVPVATSVSYGMLKGGEKEVNDGHLVVVVGFDENGKPVFNDPGRNIVRLTYERADFERAWSSSGRTVYLIHPKGWRMPGPGPWIYEGTE